MRYPDELVEEVRSKNDIVDVVSEYVRLKKQGGNYFGLCPFHNEKSPSFSVSPHKQMYYCFGCGKGGNVFTFISEYENFTYPEAIKYLADRVNVTLPEVEYTPEMKQKESKRQKLLEINKEAAKYFFYQLRNKPGEIGMKYFKERKLSDDTMKGFGLGYALAYTDDLSKYLKSKGYDDELIKESGLALFNEKYGFSDKFVNRVMFPIQDVNHRVIGFGGRVLGDAKPKYLNSPESIIFDKSKNLYGLNFARTSRKNHIIMCEGYMDVIAMHQAGFTEAAASLGTAFTQGHANLLKKYTKDVLLAYDSDAAGVSAALRCLAILRDNGLNGKVINMKPYKDPDEFIKNLGTEAFQERIDQAENGFMFEIRILSESFNLDDPADKTSFHTQIASKLLLFEEEIERNNYLESVANHYSINREALTKLVATQANKGGIIKPKSEVKSGLTKVTKEDSVKKVQRYLLTWLVEEPSLYKRISQYISADDFTDGIYRKVAERLFVDIANDNIAPAAIIDMFEDSEEQNAVAEIFNTKLEAIETDEEKTKAFHDIVVAVKKNSFEHYTSLLGGDVNAIKKVLEAKKSLEELMKRTV